MRRTEIGMKLEENKLGRGEGWLREAEGRGGGMRRTEIGMKLEGSRTGNVEREGEGGVGEAEGRGGGLGGRRLG